MYRNTPFHNETLTVRFTRIRVNRISFTQQQFLSFQ